MEPRWQPGPKRDMWCCPAQCRAVEVGWAPSDDQDQDQKMITMMRNLMCECEGESGDEKAKAEKDEREESLAKFYWVLHWGILVIMMMVIMMMMLVMVMMMIIIMVILSINLDLSHHYCWHFSSSIFSPVLEYQS